MPDTPLTTSALQALYTAGSHITAAELRQFVVSVLNTQDHSVSSFAYSLLDDADAATARTTLGLGSASTHAASDFVAAPFNGSTATSLNGILEGNGTNIVAVSAINQGQVSGLTSALAAKLDNPSSAELQIAVSTGAALTAQTTTYGLGLPVITVKDDGGNASFNITQQGLAQFGINGGAACLDNGSALLGGANPNLALRDTGEIKWTGGSHYYDAADIGIARHDANVLEVNNGTAGQFADIAARSETLYVPNDSLFMTFYNTDQTRSVGTIASNGDIQTSGSLSLVGDCHAAGFYGDGSNLTNLPNWSTIAASQPVDMAHQALNNVGDIGSTGQIVTTAGMQAATIDIRDNGTGGASILADNYGNVYLGDATGAKSVDATNRKLEDQYVQTSIDWNGRETFDSAGDLSINYDQRQLWAVTSGSQLVCHWSSGVLTMDEPLDMNHQDIWNGNNATFTGSVKVNTIASDADSTTTIANRSRQLIASDGSYVAVDWTGSPTLSALISFDKNSNIVQFAPASIVFNGGPPTSDPHVSGMLWQDPMNDYVLKVSQG